MRERRNFRITRNLVREHGGTEGCPGCRFVMGNALQGHGRNPMHSLQCRGRFEDLMSRTEDGRRRLRARDVRHGLAENLEESRGEEAGGGVGDDEEPDEREDHGVAGDEPNVEEDAEPARRVRRRVEESRGVRRARDGEESEEGVDEPPHVSRRLGQLDKAIADIVRVRVEFAKLHGMNPDEQCTREIARKMIKDLDDKHSRKLRKFKDEEKNH